MPVNSNSLCSLGMSLLLAVASVATLSGDRRLVDAAKQRDLEAIRTLLQQRVDVNTAQGDGATALHWAAHWDDLGMASLLVRAGANPNAANHYGITPLALACTNRSAAMVEALLKAGADPKAARPTGESVLMTCARTGNVDAVKALLARGADVHAIENVQGQTALMWAAAQNHAAVVRALLDAGAAADARTKGVEPMPAGGSAARGRPRGAGFTPVLFAAREGAREAIEVLLAKGANVNDVAADGSSVLQVALASGQWDLATFLLQKGADPNADGPGYTPLHWAVGSWESGFLTDLKKFERLGARGPGKLDLVKALLAHGANPNGRLRRGNPRVSLDGAELNLAEATPFVVAGISANASVMRALLAAGADPKLTSADGTTALMTAAGFGKGARNALMTPYNDALEAAQVAVEQGIDVNAANKNGETALHGAAYFGADAIVQFLVDKGAQMNPRNSLGLTPLTVAQGYGGSGGILANPSTAALLRKSGGVGDVDMVAPVAEIRTPCPQLAVFFNLNNPGYGRAWVSTNAATRYTEGTCADIKVDTQIRVKGVRESDKSWDGSVLASEIEIVK